MAEQKPIQVGGRIWLALSEAGPMGPDRIELLERIHGTGSISEAARAMGMSYKAAWDAVNTINNLSELPLVERRAGGRHGGGTQLTEQGLRLIEVYRAADREFNAFIGRLGRGVTDFEHFHALMRRLGMQTSARNELAGRVKAIRRDAVNAEVILDMGGDELVAVITNDSADRLGLRQGLPAYALIKASWIILAEAGESPRTSARNRLCGKVSGLVKGEINTEVTLLLPGGKHLTAVITNDSAERLKLATGARACALIKASHVIVAVDAS